MFFSLITVPAEAQVINLFGIPVSSELLWWPIVFFGFQVINGVYGFDYLRHSVYLVVLFHAIYILFLKFAIWLPASSFWKMQDTYTLVLGREFLYIIKSSMFLWACALIPASFLNTFNEKQNLYIFCAALMVFSLLNIFWLNPNNEEVIAELIIPLLIYCFLNTFYSMLRGNLSKIEKIERNKDSDKNLFRFHLTNKANDKFKYHHILFCSSIVFFIASKTMAAKFISIGFFTINVGGIVFSLAYLAADMMTDVYGIERTKQMVLFVIFCNLLSYSMSGLLIYWP